MQMSALDTTDTYLLLGTNLGDRMVLLKQALTEINAKIGTLGCISSIYETAAWGNKNQPNYLNQVVQVATTLSPVQLLEQTQAIEKKMGRERHGKWEARLIDIDILFYGECVVDRPDLQVPHPHLAERKFTLVPLQEIAPLLVHPLLRKNITELLNQTTDQLPVKHYNTKTYEQHKL
ncbi:2-amino-4-hydroxy-6-hydroxymethyldihydropteridinediphosphokinase [Parapedobacter indicus]|uniref:2-amino-4-hydroxy-6-hydroxymethyldihydropteridine pyrophosphokinase n=2 Tax=Parapedobacter indicus TaxID=1477437 RepID=A0A1I3UC02_9SPHI|nr:2-amino-4-hydroxy-6-hydroxymethyldihydropteridine diphosphokinase [Parapedobacter indicus]SFJ80149.1 2-amino-4-hydroxy-6-hydroxymethyldihydropteridinediphosphokinase [Parapedobacter indicus]